MCMFTCVIYIMCVWVCVFSKRWPKKSCGWSFSFPSRTACSDCSCCSKIPWLCFCDSSAPRSSWRKYGNRYEDPTTTSHQKHVQKRTKWIQMRNVCPPTDQEHQKFHQKFFGREETCPPQAKHDCSLFYVFFAHRQKNDDSPAHYAAPNSRHHPKKTLLEVLLIGIFHALQRPQHPPTLLLRLSQHRHRSSRGGEEAPSLLVMEPLKRLDFMGIWYKYTATLHHCIITLKKNNINRDLTIWIHCIIIHQSEKIAQF